ncbi:protein MIZU-KUSSEI 1 [Mercurialis annua]|uniref:protein MIZU-KUSSEI 1 n=1 Tax=Mercurialis annua TaxID=3986 RepID=UPI00215DF9D3|nr:protein MIZU-KUSSEI 1 [Mercurialis annua]
MTKIDALRRFFLPCITSPTTTSTNTTTTNTTTTHHHHHHHTKKRISTSLREDMLNPTATTNQETPTKNQDSASSSSTESRLTIPTTANLAPPRPSKTMVVGTIFGHRRGSKVWFCIQFDRFSTKSLLLLEFSIPTTQLVREMQSGLLRLALECDRPEFKSYPLRSVPVWTLYCNGRRIGFASKRKPTDQNRLMLKSMQSTTVGAGVIPAGFGSLGNSEEIMYMRANYEHAIGSANTESFHLINLDEGVGQEFSVFLMRTG